MAEVRHSSKKNQIVTLLGVIGSAVFAAAILAMAMLYHYNPPGTYRAGNMLVEPSLVATMKYSEATVRGGDNTRFVFGGLQYAYFDETSKRWKQTNVTIDRYTLFYNLVAPQNSMSSVSDAIKDKFLQRLPASLSLLSRRDNNLSTTTSDFVKIDFSADGNFYRILLRAEKENYATDDGWIYFSSDEIGQTVQKLFTE